MLAHWPEMFACGVPLCGVVDLKDVGKFRDIPIWIFHGTEDDQVPEARSKEMYAALQAVDGQVAYTPLPGQGHLITNLVYGKESLHEWIFLQRKKPAKH
jgi:predicted peptidase